MKKDNFTSMTTQSVPRLIGKLAIPLTYSVLQELNVNRVAVNE